MEGSKSKQINQTAPIFVHGRWHAPSSHTCAQPAAIESPFKPKPPPPSTLLHSSASINSIAAMEPDQIITGAESKPPQEIREIDSTKKEEEQEHPIPLMALNHVSRVCRSVKDSVDFYSKILGFVLIERPQSFDFEGAWLFNYGVGIHLVQSYHLHDDDRCGDKDHQLDPLDNHISFQCEDMEGMEERLKEMGVKYMKRRLGGDQSIEQLFFNDPDGFMIEICNCENLKVVPTGSNSARIRLPAGRHNPPLESKE